MRIYKRTAALLTAAAVALSPLTAQAAAPLPAPVPAPIAEASSALPEVALPPAPVPPADASSALPGPALPPPPAPIGEASSALPGVGNPPAPSTSIQPGSKYVAIGDSYAAVGSLTEYKPLSRNPLCGWTTDNYPQQLARMMDLNLTDVTCGFARTDEYWATQTYPVLMPDRLAQRNAVTPDTDLVTVTLGGNDMFPIALGACAPKFLTGAGPSCEQLAEPIIKKNLEGIQGKLENVLRDIHERAPHAEVILPGYLTPMVADSPRCINYGLLSHEDLAYIEGVLTRLNDIVRRAAEATGSTFVAPHTDNGACAPWGQRTSTTLGIQDNALLVHPTAYGHQVVAESIRDALQNR